MPHCPHLLNIVTFAREVGIEVTIESGAKGFLHGIAIKHGGLVVDLDNCQPSGLLHELGHVAIVPGRYRHLLNGNVSGGIKTMFADIEHMDLDPDHPLVRAAMQSSDLEATAWAWAAGVHLSIPPEIIILDVEYDKSGQSIRTALALNSYFGINGLQQAGFTTAKPFSARMQGVPAYPHMNMWLQNAGDDIDADIYDPTATADPGPPRVTMRVG